MVAKLHQSEHDAPELPECCENFDSLSQKVDHVSSVVSTGKIVAPVATIIVTLILGTVGVVMNQTIGTLSTEVRELKAVIVAGQVNDATINAQLLDIKRRLDVIERKELYTK